MNRFSPIVPLLTLFALAILSNSAYASGQSVALTLGVFGNVSDPAFPDDSFRASVGGGAKLGVGLIVAGIELSAGRVEFNRKEGHGGRSFNYADLGIYFPLWLPGKIRFFPYAALGGGYYMRNPGRDGAGVRVGGGIMIRLTKDSDNRPVFLDTSYNYRDLSGSENDFAETRIGLTCTFD